MKIKDVFTYPIERPITQVIKLDDLGPQEMAQELSEYVVTKQIEEHILAFLDAFVATRKGQSGRTDHIGVWVSGFFGSGKSHFAKILGYLLRNQAVHIDGVPSHATDIFLSRVDDDSPRKLEIRSLLTQVRNFVDADVLMFQIKSQEDQLNKAQESIAAIMYRQYLTSRGFHSDPWIGRLELMLTRKGRYDDFRRAVEASEGEPWESSRKEFALVRPAVARAMQAVMPELYHTLEEAQRAIEDVRASLSLTPESLTTELAEYARSKDAKSGERSVKMVFIIDEMGQFIGDDGQRLLELQTIAEEFAAHGQGRLWLVVTAQEALDDVISGVKQVRADYGRILERFDVKLRMTSEQIEHVIEERVLKKRPSAQPSINALFESYRGQIGSFGRPETKRHLPILDAQHFEYAYPFLPYHFPLMQDAFASLRARGGRSVMLTGAERSMLGIVQNVLKARDPGLASADLGSLVTLDAIYDQIRPEVSGNDQRAIAEVADQVRSSGYSPQRVLKAVFLLTQIEWLPRNVDNIARTLMPTVNEDFNRHRGAVEQALNALLEARYVVRVMDEYRYISAVERGIEEEIAEESLKHNDIRRGAREILKESLSGLGRLNYENGVASFDVRIVADDEDVRSTGELTLKVYSPIAQEYDRGISLAQIRDIVSPSDERTVFWVPDSITSPKPDLERRLRLEAVVKRRQRGDVGDDERKILRDKGTEIDTLKGRVSTAFNRALYSGDLVYMGDVTHLDGRTTNLNTIFNRELGKIIPSVYTRLKPAAVKVTEKMVADTLATRAENLANIEPSLHLWDPQGHINDHAPVIEPVVVELQRRGGSCDGKTLAEHFRRIPFGWELNVLRLILAALLRDGKISILVGQREIDDPRDPSAQDALTKAMAFNRAVFQYDTAATLTLEQRREAQRRIDILFERHVDDTTNTLAETIQDEIRRLRQENEILVSQVQGYGLPIADILYQGRSIVDAVLKPTRPDSLVQVFLAEVEHIRALRKLQQRLREFLGQGKGKEYQRLRRAADEVERNCSDIESLKSEAVKRALDDFRSLERERAVMDRWGELRQAGERLMAAYRQTYSDFFEARNQLYQQARDQVAEFGSPPKELTSRIAEEPGTWDDERLTFAGQSVGLRDLYTDIQLVDQRRVQAITELQQQTAARSQSDGRAATTSTPSVTFIRLAEYLKGEYADEAEFDNKLREFVSRVRLELQQKRKVLLE